MFRLSGEPMDHAACYELTVEVDDTVAIQPSVGYKKEIANIEDQVISL